MVLIFNATRVFVASVKINSLPVLHFAYLSMIASVAQI